MKVDQKYHIANNPEHLTKDEMIAYVEGKLSNRIMHRLETHLVDCELCNEALDGLSREEGIQSFSQVLSKINRPFVRKERIIKPYLVAAASLVLISLTVVSVWWLQSPEKEAIVAQTSSPKIPEQTPVTDSSRSVESFVADQTTTDKQLQEELTPNESISSPTITTSPVPKEENLAASEMDVIKSDDTTASASVGDSALADLEQDTGVTRVVTGQAVGPVAEPPRTISGRITDQLNGKPLPGANIRVAGQSITSTSNQEGIYTIEVPKDVDKLEYSYTGMETKHAIVGESDQLDVALSPETTQLSEVVTTRKAKLFNRSSVAAKPQMGNVAYRRYLRQNVHYPQTAADADIKGDVVLSVVIDRDGNIDNVMVKQSLGYGCDAEAIRLVKEGPAWLPATINHQSTVDTVSVSVRFRK